MSVRVTFSDDPLRLVVQVPGRRGDSYFVNRRHPMKTACPVGPERIAIETMGGVWLAVDIACGSVIMMTPADFHDTILGVEWQPANALPAETD